MFSSLIKLVDWKEGNYFVSDKPYPRGEVYIGGNTVGHGYYKMPEKTKEDFFTDEDGIRWFKTGDIGLIDDTGNVTLIGKKHILYAKIQGLKSVANINISLILTYDISKSCDFLIRRLQSERRALHDLQYKLRIFIIQNAKYILFPTELHLKNVYYLYSACSNPTDVV